MDRWIFLPAINATVFTLFVLLTGYWPKMENLKFWLWLVNLELEKLSLPNWSLSIWQLSTSLLQIWSLSKFWKLCLCWKALAIPKPTEMTTHLGKFKEIEIIHRLFLVIAMYFQASLSHFQSITQPPTSLAELDSPEP